MSFKPGAANTAGRPRGSRNRLQGDFLRALAADFAEHGEGVIAIARIERPVEYLLRGQIWGTKPARAWALLTP
jgi:hypothetical protein